MPSAGNGDHPSPEISVVIITRNEGAELKTTVDNVIRTVPASDREIVVVDDGSHDGSSDCLRDYPEVQLLRTNALGVARARNHGASHATGNVIIFSDAHMRLPADWHTP